MSSNVLRCSTKSSYENPLIFLGRSIRLKSCFVSFTFFNLADIFWFCGVALFGGLIGLSNRRQQGNPCALRLTAACLER